MKLFFIGDFWEFDLKMHWIKDDVYQYFSKHSYVKVLEKSEIRAW